MWMQTLLDSGIMSQIKIQFVSSLELDSQSHLEDVLSFGYQKIQTEIALITLEDEYI